MKKSFAIIISFFLAGCSTTAKIESISVRPEGTPITEIVPPVVPQPAEISAQPKYRRKVEKKAAPPLVLPTPISKPVETDSDTTVAIAVPVRSGYPMTPPPFPTKTLKPYVRSSATSSTVAVQ